MGTNRPNPQHHNQQKLQQQPIKDPTPPAVIPKTNDAPPVIDKTVDTVFDVPVIIKAPIVITTEATMTFKELLAHLFTEVLHGNISAQQSRNQMRNWYHKLSPEDQVAFRAARNENDEALNMLKGIVETLAQEVPFMYVD